ncbi:MAG TPA: FAD binding domain-containing protein [Bryobacteraceae bacterium]|nr:FAD binding domain-containing protein [Bryobacteraceae bacterium]
MTRYACPRTLADAVHLLSTEGGALLAGGTDFYPALGDRPPAGTVIDLSRVREMKGIIVAESETRIGGLTTWSELLAAALPPCFDGLKSAAREIGGVQIQNRGTVAGNLCNASPAADSVPPLLCLDAAVELRSQAGIRRMELAEFILGSRKTCRRPDEILTAVIVPRKMDHAASAFVKLGARRYLVISIVMVAAVIATSGEHIEEARVAVGACSERAKRLPALEQALIGAPVRSGIGALVTPEYLPLSPIDDIRAAASYRSDAALTLVKRALEACVENG